MWPFTGEEKATPALQILQFGKGMCSERVRYGAVGSSGFIFQHEGKKRRVLVRKADDVNGKVCRQPRLSMRSEHVFSLAAGFLGELIDITI